MNTCRENIEVLFSNDDLLIVKPLADNINPYKNDGVVAINNKTARLAQAYRNEFPTVTEEDQIVRELMNEVEIENLEVTVQHLQDYERRYYNSTEAYAAGDWIYEQFENLGFNELDGLEVEQFEFKYGVNVEIGYFDQQMAMYQSNKTVLDDYWDEFPNLTETEVRNALGAFLFTGEDVFKNVSMLSGGEKVRLALCKILKRRPNVLILDEPTNHMDIIGKETLETMLKDFKGTLIFVSHDRYFVKQVATQLLVFEDGTTNLYKFGYEEYQEKLDRDAENEDGLTSEAYMLEDYPFVVEDNGVMENELTLATGNISGKIYIEGFEIPGEVSGYAEVLATYGDGTTDGSGNDLLDLKYIQLNDYQ